MKQYLTTNQRREILKAIYVDKDWVYKIDNMPNKQIYAMFESLKKCGKISYDDAGNMIFKSDEEVKKLKEARQGWHQITLDEFLKEEEFKKRQTERKEKENLKNYG